MESSVVLGEKDYLACCGSVKFAEEMVLAGPFSDYQQTVNAARDIWFNKVFPSPSLSLYLHWWLCIYVWVFLLGEWICFQVDVNGWLEAFAAHPQIGESPSRTHKSPTSAQFSFLPLSNIFFSFVVNFLGGLGCGWETLWARLISRFWFQHFWLNDPDKAPEFLTELDIHLVFCFSEFHYMIFAWSMTVSSEVIWTHEMTRRFLCSSLMNYFKKNLNFWFLTSDCGIYFSEDQNLW